MPAPVRGRRFQRGIMATDALLASGILNTILSVLLAILILLVMITVHEFGHYVAGSALGFKINEFSVGFGPAIFKRRSKKNGRLFCVRAFPLGGYCAFEGEDDDTQSEGAFNKQHPFKRIIVLIAGAAFNYLLALLIILISTFAFGQMAYRINSVQASADYPAEYSLQAGDTLVAVDGRDIYLAADLVSALNGSKQGDEVQVEVLRGGARTEAKVVLRADCDFENSSQVSLAFHALGVGTYENDEGAFYDLTTVSCKFGFWESIGRSFMYSFKIAGSIFTVLGELLTGNLGLSAVGGPVTTIKLTSQIASQSVQSFLEIAAYIGVNLAVFNLLPIPALDGSKVVFCLIEWIFKKPVPRKIEAVIHVIGFALILGFAILVDVLQFL